MLDVPVVAITSDARLKTNVTPLANVLEKLHEIRGVSYEWNEEAKVTGRDPGRREVGVIAQEVEAVFPELVVTLGEKSYKAVDYGKLTAILIEAVKELRTEKEAQLQELRTEKDAQIAALEARLTTQDTHIAALEVRLAALEQAASGPSASHPVSSSVLSGGWIFMGGLILAGLILGHQRYSGKSLAQSL
jgi:hypothetical protein